MSMICLPVLVIILLVLTMHSVVIGFFRSLYCLYNFSYTKCVCCWLSWRKSCLGLRILCPLTSVVIPRSRSYIFACVYFCWCWLFIHPFYQGLVGTNACMFVYIFRHIIFYLPRVWRITFKFFPLHCGFNFYFFIVLLSIGYMSSLWSLHIYILSGIQVV